MNTPSYVLSQNEELQHYWTTVYNTVLSSTGDETRALFTANVCLRNKLTGVTSEPSYQESFIETPRELIAARSTRRIIRFDVDTSKEFIKRSDSGEEYLVAMLQDVYGDSDGIQWSAATLQKFADQINSGKVIVGDVDHEVWDKVLDSSITDEEIAQRLSQKRGIAKSVSAIFENGKLYVKTLIDKRYKKLLQSQAKGLSLEAVVTRNDDGKVIDGEILGFTFIVNDTPANPRTSIIA